MTDLGWQQIHIEFADRATAQDVAVRDLLPALTSAQTAGALQGWWFVRKHPWRLRYRAHDTSTVVIADVLDHLAADGRIAGWAGGIYEPETRAFGGPRGMDIAHQLFHIDSHHLLARAARRHPTATAGRETLVLLCGAMMRAAGLDWYEQGDVWGQVADLRPTSRPHKPADRAEAIAAAMRRLMTADARTLVRPSGPLAGLDGWFDAFVRTGHDLADLARGGQLTRGLRAVLAHHVIFHANRAAVAAPDLSALAALALDIVFATDRGTASRVDTHLLASKVPEMTDDRPANDAPGADRPATPADQLRDALTDKLGEQGVIRTPLVEEAFRRTPRDVFLPGIPVERAYADDPVYTKTDADGVSISAASQPWVVAAMLEQLDARPGHRVLELGAGTGYNAALLAAIVGDTGHVTTIDVDDDLVEAARRHLTAAGVSNVDVVLGDGALGHPQGAPYDRIIATVGAYETPTTWLDQLGPGGRLVVPLRLRGTNSRSIAFERERDRWVSTDSKLAVFMPLRGIADDARRIVGLTPERDITLQVYKDQDVDPDLLAGVLDFTPTIEWTQVLFPPEVPFEWMDLWLCLRLDNALMRMNVDPAAKKRGLVTPMFGWGSMATTRVSDLAYLTIRPAPSVIDGGKLYEVGVIGHGPAGKDLAHQVAEEVCVWDAHCRARRVRFEIPDQPETADYAAGRHILHRPHHPITVIWE